MKVRFVKHFLASNFRSQPEGQHYNIGKEYSIVSTIEEINETSISVAMANVAVENGFAEYVESVVPTITKVEASGISRPPAPKPRPRPVRKRKRK